MIFNNFPFQLSAKYTTDVVAAVAFGLDGQSFTNPNADFRRMVIKSH